MGRTIPFHPFAILALCAAACSGVASAENGIVLAPSSDWKFKEYDDRCRASRNFGEGKNRTTIWLEQGAADPNYNITLLGRPLRHPYGGGVRLKFGGEPEIIRSYISSKSSSGRPVLMMFGVSIVQPTLERDTETAAPDVALDRQRLLAIDTLKMRTSIVEPIELRLGSIVNASDFLSLCGKKLAAKLTGATQVLSSVAKPPTPIDQDRWLRTSDYPDHLVAAQMGGQVTARLSVNKAGKPGSCFIVDTNKPNLFNDSVCLGLMKRAKFEPARNLQGEPVDSFYFYSVSFNIR